MNINPVIAGIPTLLLIAGIVETSKKFGLKGNWLLAVSLVLGIVFGVTEQLTVLYPQIATWVQIVVYGLAVGLAASGWYDLGKRFAGQ